MCLQIRISVSWQSSLFNQCGPTRSELHKKRAIHYLFPNSAPCSSTERSDLGTQNGDDDLHLFLHLFLNDLLQHEMKCIFSLKMHLLNVRNQIICIFWMILCVLICMFICIFSFDLHLFMKICIIYSVRKNICPARYAAPSPRIWSGPII